MTEPGTARRVERIYRALLHVAPRRLRERHADDMTALFLEALTSARADGRTRTARVWAMAIGDLARARAGQLVTLARRATDRGEPRGIDESDPSCSATTSAIPAAGWKIPWAGGSKGMVRRRRG